MPVSGVSGAVGGMVARLALLVSFLALTACTQDLSRVFPDVQTFRSRPDIAVLTWNTTTHTQDQLSPGYWFVSPYNSLDESDSSGNAWAAPMIFDQAGHLIWSGAHLTHGYNSFDFRPSKVLDEDMLSFLHPHNHSLVVLDSNLEPFKEVVVANTNHSEIDNFHELNFVNDGRRVLFFADRPKNVTKSQREDLGGSCVVRETTFREADLTEDWRFGYLWMASKRIDFAESTAVQGTLDQRCNETVDGWDFAQPNSVDKFDKDGSYLLSARYTNTIYKVFRSGDIAWRLGGEQSDFEADFTFSRQNHARIVSYNSSRTIISFLDNSESVDNATTTSRGMLVSLQTDVQPMTATLLQEFPHPHGPGSFVPDQGSVQVLPDGNVFSGWVNGLTISEHSPDGALLMEAHVEQDWLKSYRSYKFPFVGQPAQPPDVFAEVADPASPKTTVYMSWNGGTEVSSWNVHRTSSDGWPAADEAVASAERSGFETTVEVDGYVAYVVAEALDATGAVIGRSNVFATAGVEQLSDDVVSAETSRLENVPAQTEELESEGSEAADVSSGAAQSSWKDKATSRSGVGSFFGVLLVFAALFFGVRVWRRRRRSWTMMHGRKPSDHELWDRNETLYALDDEDGGYDADKEGR